MPDASQAGDGGLKGWTRVGIIAWSIVGVALVLAGLLWMLGHIWEAVIPLLIGLLIVFVLRVPVDWLVGRGLSRTVATALAYLAMIVTFVLLWIVLLVPLGAELVTFAEGLPALAAQVQGQADTALTAFRQGAPAWAVRAADSAIVSISASLGDIGTSAANGVLAAGGSLIGFFGSLLMGMIVGFFLLMSLPEVTWSATHLIPSRIRAEVLEIAHRSYRVLASWLRGTAITSGVIGGVCVIGFALVGLPFAVPLGIITGLTDIVPYIGPLFAAALVFLIGLTKGWVTAALAVAVLLAVQQSTDMFIGPRIQSDATGLHPAVVVLALLAGSSVAGIPGMLAAIPVAGIAQAVFQYYSDKYRWTEPLPEPPGPEQTAEAAE